MKGTSDCPRMSVHRSLRNISVQFIDDERGRTLTAVSTLSPDFREKHPGGGATVAAASPPKRRLEELFRELLEE